MNNPSFYLIVRSSKYRKWSSTTVPTRVGEERPRGNARFKRARDEATAKRGKNENYAGFSGLEKDKRCAARKTDESDARTSH